MTDRNSSQAPPPRRRIRRILLLIAIPVVLFVAVLLVTVMTLTQPVVDAGNSFMAALKQGDFSRAYALSTPELQRELGSPADMAARVGSARPADWSWSSRSIRNGTGRVSGSYASLDGRPGSALLVMHKVGGEWRIDTFRLGPG